MAARGLTPFPEPARNRAPLLRALFIMNRSGVVNSVFFPGKRWEGRLTIEGPGCNEYAVNKMNTGS